MTCVVAAIVDGVAVVGADSQSSGGWTKYTAKTDKIFRVSDEVLFGGSGSWRELQAARYHVRWDRFDFSCGHDIESLIVKFFIPELRTSFRDSGTVKTENGRDESSGAYLLVVRDRIFRIDSDFQVLEIAHPFAAVGSGESVAMGAMFVAHLGDSSAKRVAEVGLMAASEFATGVGGPFRFLEHNVQKGE